MIKHLSEIYIKGNNQSIKMTVYTLANIIFNAEQVKLLPITFLFHIFLEVLIKAMRIEGNYQLYVWIFSFANIVIWGDKIQKPQEKKKERKWGYCKWLNTK